MNQFLSTIINFSLKASTVFYSLLFMSLSAAIIGATILIVRHIADKKISPFWKYAMWALVVVALIVPYRPKSDFSLMTSKEEVNSVYENFLLKEEQNIIAPNENDEMTSPEDINILPQQNQNLSLKTAIFSVTIPIVWLLGSVSLFAFFVFSKLDLDKNINKSIIQTEKYNNILSQCKKDLGLSKDGKITVQSYLKTPAVRGLVKPEILLPNFEDSEITDESLYYVILHELAHFKRGDLLVNYALLILQCLYWFNPLVWLLFKFIREDMEILNDSYVLGKIDKSKSKNYAVSLVEVLSHSKNISVVPRMVCMVDNVKNVERRIKMIKLGENFKKHKVIISVVSLTIIALISTLFLTSSKENISNDDAAIAIAQSINSDGIQMSFLIPKNYKIPDDFQIFVSGRSENGGGMSVHLFEDENYSHSWKNGKKYYIDMVDKNYSELNMDIMVGETESNIDLLRLNSLIFAHQNRTNYIGDAPKVQKICVAITGAISPNFSYDHIELKTNDADDLSIIAYINGSSDSINSFLSSSESYKAKQAALEILSLVENANNVSIIAINDNGGNHIISIQKDEAEEIMGKDYFKKTESLDGFLKLSSSVTDSLTATNASPQNKIVVDNLKEKKITFPNNQNNENPNNDPDVDLANKTEKFDLVGKFPESWEFAVANGDEKDAFLPGTFFNRLLIYDKNISEKPIAQLGFCPFFNEIDENEMTEENYYKAVYTDLRLSRFFFYDPYEAVSRFDSGETGVADVYYLEPDEIENYMGSLPNCPSVETLGILSYNKDLKVYIGISFAPEVITREDVKAIAETIKIVSSTLEEN